MAAKTYLMIGAICTAAVLAAGALLVALDRGGDTVPAGPYVALGDSYTAGPGIPSQTGTPSGCQRSDRNYPALVAAELKVTGSAFRDVSCTGATIADLAAAQSTRDGANPSQLSALSASTRLVTIGIGGNDIGFTSLITSCVTAGLRYYAMAAGLFASSDAPCRERQGTSATRQKIDTAASRLSGTLAEIRQRAPRAKVYLVGYPAVLPSGGVGCSRQLVLAPGDVTYLREIEQQLNVMLRNQAMAAGAAYIDTYTPSTGRDACSAQATRWIEPLLPDAPAASVHPNERGERGMAAAVLHALET